MTGLWSEVEPPNYDTTRGNLVLYARADKQIDGGHFQYVAHLQVGEIPDSKTLSNAGNFLRHLVKSLKS